MHPIPKLLKYPLVRLLECSFPFFLSNQAPTRFPATTALHTISSFPSQSPITMSSEPNQPETMDLPRPKRQITTTEAWNEAKGFHQVFADISLREQAVRNKHLMAIYHNWSTLESKDILLPGTRPVGMPAALRDISTVMLEPLAALAKLTSGDLARAHRFLRAAPTDRGGWDGAAVGAEDIRGACVLVEREDERDMILEQQPERKPAAQRSPMAAPSSGSGSATRTDDEAYHATPLRKQKADEEGPNLRTQRTAAGEARPRRPTSSAAKARGPRGSRPAKTTVKNKSKESSASTGMWASLMCVLKVLLAAVVLIALACLAMVVSEMRNRTES